MLVAPARVDQLTWHQSNREERLASRMIAPQLSLHDTKEVVGNQSIFGFDPGFQPFVRLRT